MAFHRNTDNLVQRPADPEVMIVSKIEGVRLPDGKFRATIYDENGKPENRILDFEGVSIMEQPAYINRPWEN